MFSTVLCVKRATYLLALASGGVSLAQRAPAQTVEEYESRVDSLTERRRVARAVVARAESLEARRNIARLDTIRSGPITVLADRSVRALAREAALMAGEQIEIAIGPAATLFADHEFYLYPEEDPLNWRALRLGEKAHRIALERRTDAEEVARKILVSAEEPMGRSVGQPFIYWLSTLPHYLLRPEPPHQRSRVYTELVTAPSQAAQGCLLGNISSCRDALALDRSSGAVTRWYTAEERRLVAASFRPPRRPRSARDRHQRCVRDQSDEACTAILTERAERGLVAPISWRAHQTLFHAALDLGGSRAIARLIERDSTLIAEHLASAAGVELDSLLTFWRSRIIAARPEPTIMKRRTKWSAMAWGLLMAFLALRSTRWR